MAEQHMQYILKHLIKISYYLHLYNTIIFQLLQTIKLVHPQGIIKEKPTQYYFT